MNKEIKTIVSKIHDNKVFTLVVYKDSYGDKHGSEVWCKGEKTSSSDKFLKSVLGFDPYDEDNYTD